MCALARDPTSLQILDSSRGRFIRYLDPSGTNRTSKVLDAEVAGYPAPIISGTVDCVGLGPGPLGLGGWLNGRIVSPLLLRNHELP